VCDCKRSLETRQTYDDRSNNGTNDAHETMKVNNDVGLQGIHVASDVFVTQAGHGYSRISKASSWRMDNVAIACMMPRPFVVRRAGFSCCSHVAVEAVTYNTQAMVMVMVMMVVENVAELRGDVRP
jgi:hypothetical protein